MTFSENCEISRSPVDCSTIWSSPDVRKWEYDSVGSMHQSERVTSTTSGHEALEAQDADSRDNTGEEDSDTDSWPEDSTSPNDSKYCVDKVDKV